MQVLRRKQSKELREMIWRHRDEIDKKDQEIADLEIDLLTQGSNKLIKELYSAKHKNKIKEMKN